MSKLIKIYSALLNENKLFQAGSEQNDITVNNSLFQNGMKMTWYDGNSVLVYTLEIFESLLMCLYYF